MAEWRDDIPIYRQIAETLIARCLDGTYQDGDMLPSVRQLADEFSVSPLTGAKVIKQLEQLDITVKRRGIGFQIAGGATEKLLHSERRKFLSDDWPGIEAKLRLLKIDLDDLMGRAL